MWTAHPVLLHQRVVEPLRQQSIEQRAAFLRRQLPRKFDQLVDGNWNLKGYHAKTRIAADVTAIK